jgi:hypothetical protein
MELELHLFPIQIMNGRLNNEIRCTYRNGIFLMGWTTNLCACHAQYPCPDISAGIKGTFGALEAYPAVPPITHNKNPHKCPVCEGKGKVFSSMCESNKCHACEGKGIVWG